VTDTHPNLEILGRLDPHDMANSGELFAEDAVLHYFNPNLPELQGDYVGREGIQAFFRTLGEMSRGSFRVEPMSATPAGDELVVVQSRNTLTLGHRTITLHVVVVWRIVDGRIVEVWDIVPARPVEVRDAAS
jgi:predicted SnoaL-like aldol condensation-catalyzing enzyme